MDTFQVSVYENKLIVSCFLVMEIEGIISRVSMRGRIGVTSRHKITGLLWTLRHYLLDGSLYSQMLMIIQMKELHIPVYQFLGTQQIQMFLKK